MAPLDRTRTIFSLPGPDIRLSDSCRHTFEPLFMRVRLQQPQAQEFPPLFLPLMAGGSIAASPGAHDRAEADGAPPSFRSTSGIMAQIIRIHFAAGRANRLAFRGALADHRKGLLHFLVAHSENQPQRERLALSPVWQRSS
jgi:hypothetical protein